MPSPSIRDSFRASVPERLSIMIDANGNLHLPSSDDARIYNGTLTHATAVKNITVSIPSGCSS